MPPKVFMQEAFLRLGKDKLYVVFADNPIRAKAELAAVERAGYELTYVSPFPRSPCSLLWAKMLIWAFISFYKRVSSD